MENNNGAIGTAIFVGVLVVVNLCSWYFHWGFWLY